MRGWWASCWAQRLLGVESRADAQRRGLVDRLFRQLPGLRTRRQRMVHARPRLGDAFGRGRVLWACLGLRQRLEERLVTVCVCIGCGCDDNHACEDLFGDPCSWLEQSTTNRRGVCSNCAAYLRRWQKGERNLSARAKAAVQRRKQAR